MDVDLDPVGVASIYFVDGPAGDARDVIAVEADDPGDQRVGRRVGRLENGGDFLGALDLAFPAIDRMNRSENVDAGGEPLLHDRASDALRLLGVGEDRID